MHVSSVSLIITIRYSGCQILVPYEFHKTTFGMTHFSWISIFLIPYSRAIEGIEAYRISWQVNHTAIPTKSIMPPRRYSNNSLLKRREVRV